MLEATHRLGPGLAGSPLAGDVRLSRLVMPGLAEGDRVQRPVEPPVATSVEAVTIGSMIEER